jgi:hypothetical protein
LVIAGGRVIGGLGFLRLRFGRDSGGGRWPIITRTSRRSGGTRNPEKSQEDQNSENPMRHWSILSIGFASQTA